MKITVEISPTIAQLADAFCQLTDDDQAQFFIECARIMQSWGGAHRAMQAHYIGRHLRDCQCSTYEARELVREIAEAAQP